VDMGIWIVVLILRVGSATEEESGVVAVRGILYAGYVMSFQARRPFICTVHESDTRSKEMTSAERSHIHTNLHILNSDRLCHAQCGLMTLPLPRVDPALARTPDLAGPGGTGKVRADTTAHRAHAVGAQTGRILGRGEDGAHATVEPVSRP
jgi:hypothetical protein